MNDYLFIIPLFIAVALGWLLGRRQRDNSLPAQNTLQQEYFRGLDFLLSEKTDEAIESFIRALEVNSDTIPAHLALAKLFRKKGDVERAIQIHQNLLARSDLSREDFLRIQMALARDYFAVGLFDRAENLLLEIQSQRPGPQTQQKAISLLIKLYEKEKEWQRAIEVARQLSADELEGLEVELSHYCCELAEGYIGQQRYRHAVGKLNTALSFDKGCVRASLLSADMAIRQEDWKGAIRELKRIAVQDPLFLSETVKRLKQCYSELNQMADYEKLMKQWLSKYPSTSIMLAQADMILERQGAYPAGAFITDQLKHRPSVKGFNQLIDLYIAHASKGTNESLMVLRGLTGQLELSKPVYNCQRCGFSGKSLHWQCPSCQSWGTTKPIQGLEGE
ncbi:Lipopolysaccharide biosynthesis regulator YciM, contains six TPR domains and a predicted metal-binding C-terminal domain [Amphritea atlantica]|jgi:lipopolysaccharide biosynthesis regulator YciM|uniref:Lipopolysaccharide assembly protein B n=1 Tax=Amphritea atlantica TaxID=355243 RepID=A0A1H9JDM5_9GAMM|nr:lipopolysaccharide assembly protein LapB [Amphritea atlantica]SEQ84932.1 Lipopolysaccharide biosynthesis regulator YciM, contains six TPR domains and a predicted metal-binding C-terminal domain [Amphritea atlantica]